MFRFIISLVALGCCQVYGFTLMNWNIHRGVGMDGKLDLPRIAAIIREQKPDAVLLQEVDHGTKRSGGVKQADELAKLLGWQVYFGKAIDLQGGGYGQAILSPHPLKNARVYRLSEEGEARIAVAAELSVDDKEMTVIGVHLDAYDAERRLREAKALVAQLKGQAAHVFVAGDWNEQPADALAVFLQQEGWLFQKKTGPVQSWPEDKPTVEIDFVFAKGVNAEGKSQVIDVKGASDHRAVVTKW